MGAPVQALLMAAASDAAAGDPYWSDVALLVHADGTDGSTTFTDASPRARSVYVYGNAQVDTAQSKFGGASALLDGSGDYLAGIWNTTAVDIGTGDFTIEFWVRWNSVANAGLFHMHTADPANSVAYLAVGYSGAAFSIYANGTTYNRTYSVSTGVWYHVALVRVSGVMTLYIDGVAQGAAIANVGNYNDALHTFIGLYYSTSYTHNGWIDEFRVTKRARYVGDFTPPTAPFPDS